MTEEILEEIQSHYHRLKQAEAQARYWYEHYLDDLQARYQQQLQEIEATFQTKRDRAQSEYQQALAEAGAALAQAGQETQAQVDGMRSAFRWAISPWDDVVWESYAPLSDALIPSAVRVGRLVLPDDPGLGDLPALAPLIGEGHLFLDGDDPEAARQLLQTLLLRLVVSSPPGTVRLILADPVGLGRDLSAFLRLPQALRGDKVYARLDEIGQQLETIVHHIEGVIQTRLLNLHPTIEAYNEQAGEVAVPYHILALTDFPAGFDDRMAKRLLHIARSGPRAGVYILATLNHDHPPPRDFNLDTLTDLGISLHLTAPDQLTWDDPEFGEYPIAPDPMPSADRVNRWLEAVSQAALQAQVSLAFSRIATPEAAQWTGNTIDELRVPIGVSGTGEVHYLSLGQGVVHHALIGGITQSGKTNLLHVLITQMALRYPPEELQCYLVDFKEGVEFQSYLNLPHARVVALESEREFGLSILRRLRAEVEERGRLYKAAGVGINHLVAYRQQTGQILPRIVLIMDEFQVLFAEDDMLSRDAAQILEDLARRGAAFGMHMVLSSQSPSVAGVYGNRIYNQIGLRIALQCRAQDAQAILGEGNEAADQLEQPGEAIYNDEMGHKEKNVFMRVALLPAQDRPRYLEAIRTLAGDRRYPAPVTFEGQAPARLEANPELLALLDQPGWPARTPVTQVWLGDPIEIKAPTAAPLERYVRSNLLIAGGDEAQGHGLLVAALLSLAAQHAPDDARFLVANFARPASPFAGLFENLPLPHPLEVAGPRQVGDVLTQLTTLVDQRVAGEAPDAPDVYFLIAGLHRWRELRPPDPYGQSEAGQQLLHLAEEGPEVGVHLIVWADGFTTLERAFKRSGVGAFDLRAVLRLPEADSNALLGSPVAARLEDNRALFRHEDWELGRVEKFKPYAVPEAEVLNELVERIRAKAASQGGNHGPDR